MQGKSASSSSLSLLYTIYIKRKKFRWDLTSVVGEHLKLPTEPKFLEIKEIYFFIFHSKIFIDVKNLCV